MMTGTETMNQHTILATRLGDLTVVRSAGHRRRVAGGGSSARRY